MPLWATVDFKVLAFQNPELKILADFKILAFENSHFKILADFKILAFQNPQFKILADFYGGPQRQYTNIYYITSFYILEHKHIHCLCEYIYQYNKIYTSTTICIPVQTC